jgi:hypothetical protein
LSDGGIPEDHKPDQPPSWRAIVAKLVEAYANAQRTDGEKEKAENRAANWTAGATVAIAILTAVTIGVGISQYVIFDRQLTVMQGQRDEMKQSFAPDRAYVFLDRFDGYANQPIQPGAVANFWLRNFGRTPGILTAPPGAKCAYSPDGFHPLSFKADNPKLVDGDGRLPEGFIIPIDKPFGPFAAKQEATTEQIAKARDGMGKIYCQAMIGYADVRDALHETHICLFYDFGVGDFYLCPEKGANRHS